MRSIMRKGGTVKKGFTIIEVILVLAIAGLIFLMAFIALPTLQRNARDAQRRDDMLMFADALKKFQTNNRGVMPTTTGSYSTTVVATASLYTNTSIKANTWAGFYRDYLPKPFTDPGGGSYRIVAVQCAPNASGGCTGTAQNLINDVGSNTNQSIFVILQASCQGETAIGSSNPRKAVIMYNLEGSGVYCGDV